MVARAYSKAAIRRVFDLRRDEHLSDALAIEEPLEIRLGYREEDHDVRKAISITMRTPGDDLELAAGFLFAEGIIKSADEIARIGHCGPRRFADRLTNTVLVELERSVEVDLKRLERHFYTSSSCGVCGKSSIEALDTGIERSNSAIFGVASGLIHRLPEKLLAAQTAFGATGGLHASGLFDAEGRLEIIREDVGRHNALDKVIGYKLLAGQVPISDRILMVSGRASFELVQKSLMAGIQVLAAVGAPSSLAVELAAEYEMTLIGFVRDGRFNIYTDRGRIV